jgi:hypothetical protein
MSKLVISPSTPLPVFSGRPWFPASPKEVVGASSTAIAPPSKRRMIHDDDAAVAADVVSAIDSLLHDDDATLSPSLMHHMHQTPRASPVARDHDDNATPPPPTFDDDNDDTASEASVRSSPDDNYEPKYTIPGPDFEPQAAAAEQLLPSKVLVPFQFGSAFAIADADDAIELEELEATSARNDEDEGSYNGGATDEDEGEEIINSDGDFDNGYAEAPAGEESTDNDFTVTTTSSGKSRHLFAQHAQQHPHLDMDAQRRQLEWERSQQRAAYHSEMQRTVCLAADDRQKALQCLMNEAHRYHNKNAHCGRPHVATPVWRDLAESVHADFSVNGHPNVQRNLSCMCIFSTISAAKQYGDHEEERARRQAGQHRTLQALRLQNARGGSALFLKSPATSLHRPPLLL